MKMLKNTLSLLANQEQISAAKRLESQDRFYKIIYNSIWIFTFYFRKSNFAYNFDTHVLAQKQQWSQRCPHGETDIKEKFERNKMFEGNERVGI